MGIFDWKHWVVILVVVVLVFGTKKLKNLGSDLGETIKGFRRAMSEDDKTTTESNIALEKTTQPNRPAEQSAEEPLKKS